MANDPKTNKAATAGASGGVSTGTENWDDDVRSLPLYNVTECDGAPIRGYLVDVQVLGKEENSFLSLVVKLTAPTKAKQNDEIITVDAGGEIFVHGADLRDLDKVALDPEFVREYLLTPRRKKDGSFDQLKLKAPKQPMQFWNRKVNPERFKRSVVCPSRQNVLPVSQVQTLLLAQKAGEGDTSFDTSTMK